jgi:hypothetical protein
METNTFDLLTRELLRLRAHLPGTPFLIGGGMGLYLRSRYYKADRSPRYPLPVPIRSTKDLDVILSAELIADTAQMDRIRDALDHMGYSATTRYFQFAREIGDSGRDVEIDLLAAPPSEGQADAVKKSGFRVRPRESKHIHGRITEEARSIDRDPVPIDLSAAARRHEIQLDNPTIYVPSSFNYLILKLHAFSDRKADEGSDYGRHHAMDIFATVTDMSKADWRAAENHFEEECQESYLQKAIDIQQRFFASSSDLGILRIQENMTYQRHSAEFDMYLPSVIEDLNDLFSGC